jgi:hypothetical protein
MGSHDPFEYLKHKLWPKEGLGIKLPIWLPATKSQESPWNTFVKVACHISLKSSWQGVQLCFKTHRNWSSGQEIMAFQIAENPNFENFGTFNGSPKTKWHLDVAPMANSNNTIRKKVVAFPKSQSWWILWVRVCPWLVCALKVLQLCTNQLVWFVHVCVNNWPSCHLS